MRLTCFLALTCAVLERSHAIAESEVALTSDIAPVSRILQPNAQSAEYSSERKSLRSRDSPEEEATALLAVDEERVLEPAGLLAPLLDKVANVMKKIWSKPSQFLPVQLKLDQPKLSRSNFDQLELNQLKLDQIKLGQLKPPQPVPGQFELHVPPHQIGKRTSTMQRSERVADLVAYGRGKARPSTLQQSERLTDSVAFGHKAAGPSALKKSKRAADLVAHSQKKATTPTMKHPREWQI
ncbi:unnamed protein product [Hyaloperonospora brassicae]|nr:unnamed protein product [Hyaloperonospora brassicae]